MINKDSLRIYLEWYGYKNDSLHEVRKIHNQWILPVGDWIKDNHIVPSDFIVWTNKDIDEEYKNHLTLGLE